ncbi:hypothetical protein, conserved [Plasmodium gonderi]|uniref:RNA-editing substrate-binding complex 8 protein HEAT repeats domain-containing protein n=1 Tax=Plasmodium gonderi TaxID=77519 RepID=A0A1Y1JRZ2_PLAGO|nr:hypothetical protein, conserved [Plasmodium gonderi]GAW83592.1 hypothetical protein, conserved [Plasmodium gonderi]
MVLKCLRKALIVEVFPKREKNRIFEMNVRCMKNKRRGLKEQSRKKPLDIEKKIKNPDKYEEKMHFDNLIKGELYVPESCKGKKLAMLCNRLYYFNINDEELLDRYAQRAIVIVNSLGTKEISLILNTMRKFNHRNEKLLDTFAKHIPSKLHKGVPQDISLILNAYSHFNFIDKNLFNRICEEIPHKIPYFEHTHISSVVNAFYKLNIKDRIIIDDLVDEIIDRIDEFDAKSLTNIINSFSKLNYKNENKKVIWTTFIKGVRNLHKEFNFLETTLITNAFCKKKFKSEKVYHLLYEVLSCHIFEKNSIKENNSFLLCTIAHSFAKIKFYKKDLFHFILSHFSNEHNYVSLDSQHFSQLIYSCSAFNLNDKLFLDTYTKMVTKRMEKKKNELNEQALSTIAYSFAKLKIRDTNFFVLLSSYIIKEKICLSPQSLSLICYSYSKLKIKSQMLFYILSIQIFQNMNMFTKQGLSLILSAYANLKIFHVKMFDLINKYLTLYIDSFTPKECVLIASNYKHVIKCITDEVEQGNEEQAGTAVLLKTSNTKKELDNFVSLLKDKIEIFERQNKSGLKLNDHHDLSSPAGRRKGQEEGGEEKGDEGGEEKGDEGGEEKGDEEGEEKEDEEGEESFFSIFNQNDIIYDDSMVSEENPEGTSKNRTSYNDGTCNEGDYNNIMFNVVENRLTDSDSVISQVSDNIHDIKKKEGDAQKIYEKMFLSDVECGNTCMKDKIPLINEELKERLHTILNKQQNNCIEDENEKCANKTWEKTTKSLLELMTSNKPPKINYENENFIKSAEQVETEFIKEYISEQQEHNDKDKNESLKKIKGRKKKVHNMLSKNYQLVSDLTTLKKKWNDFYKPS